MSEDLGCLAFHVEQVAIGAVTLGFNRAEILEVVERGLAGARLARTVWFDDSQAQLSPVTSSCSIHADLRETRR